MIKAAKCIFLVIQSTLNGLAKHFGAFGVKEKGIASK